MILKKFKVIITIALTAFLLIGCVDNSGTAISDYVEESEITEVSRPSDEMEWTGEWKRNLLHAIGVLEISDVTNDEFSFELEVYSGGNVGTIEGAAIIVNDSASFSMDDSACKIDFNNTGEKIHLLVTDECQSLGGNGTFFHGDYEKEPASLMVNLVDQGILTEEENKLFKKVTGADYELFVTNMMLVSETEDMDGLNTKVMDGFVRGVAPSMKAIIMINDADVYAAVPDKDGSSLLFYTNNPDYNDRLPETISQWNEETVPYQKITYK